MGYKWRIVARIAVARNELNTLNAQLLQVGFGCGGHWTGLKVTLVYFKFEYLFYIWVISYIPVYAMIDAMHVYFIVCNSFEKYIFKFLFNSYDAFLKGFF